MTKIHPSRGQFDEENHQKWHENDLFNIKSVVMKEPGRPTAGPVRLLKKRWKTWKNHRKRIVISRARTSNPSSWRIKRRSKTPFWSLIFRYISHPVNRYDQNSSFTRTVWWGKPSKTTLFYLHLDRFDVEKCPLFTVVLDYSCFSMKKTTFSSENRRKCLFWKNTFSHL
jgi:hypothetical protein